MGHFLEIVLSFPAVVYTVVLGVVLVYWVFVMIGAAHVNLLGEGAADSALDGMAKGALEGATKGMLEGVADHVDAVADAGGDGGGGHEGGGPEGLMAALKLRSAPATVVLSVLVLFSFVFAVGAMQALQALQALALGGLGASLAKTAVLLLAPVLSLLPTSLAVRPLARVFAPPAATHHEALVGRTCTIRTGTVTDRFGEATLEDGGAGVVVRVRVDAGEKLTRGEQALIVGYDAERQEFTVASMSDMLEERRRTAR